MSLVKYCPRHVGKEYVEKIDKEYVEKCLNRMKKTLEKEALRNMLMITHPGITSGIRIIRSKECSICWEKLDEDNKHFWWKCGHSFHESCIQKWEGNCPNCRQSKKPVPIRQSCDCSGCTRIRSGGHFVPSQRRIITGVRLRQSPRRERVVEPGGGIQNENENNFDYSRFDLASLYPNEFIRSLDNLQTIQYSESPAENMRQIVNSGIYSFHVHSDEESDEETDPEISDLTDDEDSGAETEIVSEEESEEENPEPQIMSTREGLERNIQPELRTSQQLETIYLHLVDRVVESLRIRDLYSLYNIIAILLFLEHRVLIQT